jgi:hypothetical protein
MTWKNWCRDVNHRPSHALQVARAIEAEIDLASIPGDVCVFFAVLQSWFDLHMKAFLPCFWISFWLFSCKHVVIVVVVAGKREVCMVAVEEHLRKVKEAEERRKAEESDDEIVFSDEED